MMRCPKCRSKTEVLETRYDKGINTNRRRLQCKKGHRCTSYEIVVSFGKARASNTKMRIIKGNMREIIITEQKNVDD